VAFKAIDSVLRGQNGGFDSHTLPPRYRFAIGRKLRFTISAEFVRIAGSTRSVAARSVRRRSESNSPEDH
jgi:hypothetical protein